MENATTPLRFVGYTRVSTVGQAVNGISLEAQETRIRSWATERGALELGMFTDAGISGGSMNGRPGLAAALALATKQKATLVVYSLSRLARSTKDAIDISTKLDAAKANFVSLTESIDTTNGMGRFFFTMMAAVATLERDMASERTKMAFVQKRANHERTSQRLPYGWDLLPDKKHLARNEFEQNVLIRIRSLRENGWSYRRIAGYLQADGIKTKTGKTFWTATTLMRILAVPA